MSVDAFLYFQAWGIMLKVLMPKQNPVNSLQNYLPKYPLPKLEETCEKYTVFLAIINELCCHFE